VLSAASPISFEANALDLSRTRQPIMHTNEPIAIKVEHLSKQYIINRDRRADETFREALARAFTAPFRRFALGSAAGAEREEFRALKDLSFEVPRGEVVGSIGRNGAGKSTLLKILSRITAPTQGHIEIRGRVASLLEVGTGFHGELTGRENIYLNGAILGMRRAEISRKFDDIVGFAEVEKFINTPVKHYSSGMYVRLAFAVAAHLDVDILFVDEVLAVGDAEFQRRCINKMRDISSTGRTVLFVSHNATALRNLCSSGLLLEDGAIVKKGTIKEVLSEYVGSESDLNTKSLSNLSPRGNAPAVLTGISVAPVAGMVGDPVQGTRAFTIGLEVEVNEPGDIAVFVECYDDNHQPVFSTGSFFEKDLNGHPLECGQHLFECVIPGHLLNDGVYVLDAHLVKNRQTVFLSEKAVISFRVHDDFKSTDGWNWRPVGAIRPETSWRHRVQTLSQENHHS
jgi:lipopolysaccharide transport system ATP-binding protein